MPDPPAAGPRAPDEEVVAAIAAVFQKHEKVETQRRLREAVQKELQRLRPGAKVGGPRVRLLAARSGIVRVETSRAKVGDGIKGVHDCPVCQHKLRKVRNRTLAGGQVLIGLRCPRCGYKSGQRIAVPTRYVFHRR